MQTQNFKLIIAYNGKYFKGVVPQPNSITIGQQLKECFYKLGWKKVSLHFCARTDAGVHAQENWVQVHVKEWVGEVCVDLMNLILPAHLKVKSIFEDQHFQAIGPKTTKKYQYKLSMNVKDIGCDDTLYWDEDLNFSKMKQACESFQGNHDFFFFQKGESQNARNQSRRNIIEASLKYLGGDQAILMEVTCNGFLRHMVRYMMGALINIGKGTYSLSDLEHSLEKSGKGTVGFLVPPEGLTLQKIELGP